MRPKAAAIFQLTLLALAVGFFLWVAYPLEPTKQDDVISTASTTRMTLFPDVNIEAKSAYVYDVVSGKALYEKEAELQWPLASLTKLMSALTASELLPQYLIVKITSDDLREEGDTGLRPEEEWNLGKLIDYSLMVSSNDGMRAIASVAGMQIGTSSTSTPQQYFIGQMNKNAVKLGLKQSYYLNQSGLDVSHTLSGGYGSAKDVAILVDYILKKSPHLLEATSLQKTAIASHTESHAALNTNKAINSIPNVIASKTGYTELSGGNVVVAFDAGINRPIIISVLGSTYDGRFVDLKTLVDATLTYLSSATGTPVLSSQ